MLRVVVVASLLASVLAGSGAARGDDASAVAPGADEAPAASEGFNRLVDAVQNGSSFKVRATAAVALGRIGDVRAIPVLARVVKEDDSYAVRAAAAAGLGRLNDAGAIGPLLEALHDGDEYVRNEASDALDHFHTAAFLFAFRESLRSEDPVLRLAAVRAYGDVMREPSASAGISAFVINALGDDDDGIAQAAEVAVSAIAHERAVPLLIDGLVNGGSAVRGACARLIEKRADPRAVEPLIAVIVDTDEPEDVRRPARAALKRHLEYVDVGRFSVDAGDASKGEEGKTDRLTALRVLAALGDQKAQGLVESSLRDSDPGVRIAGARAAVDLGGPKARQALEQATSKETDPRQKRQLELLLKSMAR